jgi:pimeloyl-ACP methyl ester carboxylesterase
VSPASLGIKVNWTAEDLARAAAVAARPHRIFDTRAEAVQRQLRLAGLTGLMNEDDSRLTAAVTADGEGWRPVVDPAAFGVGAPAVPALLSTVACPVMLGAGEHDPMCTAEVLAALPTDHFVLPGLGHNAHIEQPAALLPLIELLAMEASLGVPE